MCLFPVLFCEMSVQMFCPFGGRLFSYWSVSRISDVYQWINGQIKHGIYMQWNSIQSEKVGNPVMCYNMNET